MSDVMDILLASPLFLTPGRFFSQDENETRMEKDRHAWKGHTSVPQVSAERQSAARARE